MRTLVLALAAAVWSPQAHAQTGPTTLVVVAPAFFALSVSDLDASESWYRNIFGVERRREVTSRDGRGRARVLAKDGLVIELIQYAESAAISDFLADAHPLRLWHIFKTGVFVQDASAAHELLRGKDVAVDDRVHVDEELRMKTFIFRDRDGNRIQVFERHR